MLLHDIAKGRGGDHSETRRRDRAEGGARTRPVGGGDRDGLVAGAAPPAAEPDRVQARHRRSEDHPRPRRHHPVARAAAAAAGADGRRHARRVAQGVERLEGDAAARALCARRGGAGGRAVHHRARRAGRTRAQAGRRGAAGRLAEGGHRAVHRHSAIPATGCRSIPRRMPATHGWCATRRRARRR